LYLELLFTQKKPKEVKQETEVKTVKTNHGEKVTKKSVKVATRETSNIELDKNDKNNKNKIDQDRVSSTIKVEKEVYIDNDDSGYNSLSKETYYISKGRTYIFSPIEKGLA
jgi:hypothetical protein|tara:strand:- start:57 stop:389 length:333 start_codon:yes stop_codon:yes gene_type:complete